MVVPWGYAWRTYFGWPRRLAGGERIVVAG
jgi:hypothetical protein